MFFIKIIDLISKTDDFIENINLFYQTDEFLKNDKFT